MKYREIFKKWHFWLFVFLDFMFGFTREINYVGFFDIFYWYIYVAYIVGAFLIVSFIYTILWLFFWRKKKE